MINNLQIILDINKKIVALTNEEREDILEILKYHECEPMAAAERISELLGVSFECIFELL